jgi:hypothetical protein
MTKSTEPAPSQTRTSQSDPKRREMRRSHASEPKSGHLAQLATLINDSPRVQALKAMSGWMNPANAPPAQLAASPTQAPREGGLSNGLGAGEGNLSEHSSANVVQRKILVNGSSYSGTSASPPAVREAVDDEFLRRYESEEEVLDHLDRKTATPFGLIKPRALWYRIPFLSKAFFVFGESHAAVRGERIQEASNIRKPILDEAKQGWNVGQALSGEDSAGVDENSSKLLRALEAWNRAVFADRSAEGAQPAPSPAPPKIPSGQASARDTERGTYRLVVYDENGQETWWKPSGQQAVPQSTHDFEAEVRSAIISLFPLVFATEISNGTLNDLVSNAKDSWEMFKIKYWEGRENALNIQKAIANNLYLVARKKASGEYAKLQETRSDVTKTEDKQHWTADDYRNEFMFVRILEAAAKGNYAFATVGDNHLRALKDRLAAKSIPYLTMADFFDRYSRDAVDTHAIAHANSPKFRKNQRLVLWLVAAFREYPNLQQMHLDTLTAEDMGEFVVKGRIAKWEQAGGEAGRGQHNQPVLQQWFRDLKKEYPNSDDFISDLTFAQVGEFLTEGKIGAWEELH